MVGRTWNHAPLLPAVTESRSSLSVRHVATAVRWCRAVCMHHYLAHLHARHQHGHHKAWCWLLNQRPSCFRRDVSFLQATTTTASTHHTTPRQESHASKHQRTAKPVPPVVSTKSTPMSSHQCLILAWISSGSSGTHAVSSTTTSNPACQQTLRHVNAPMHTHKPRVTYLGTRPMHEQLRGHLGPPFRWHSTGLTR